MADGRVARRAVYRAHVLLVKVSALSSLRDCLIRFASRALRLINVAMCITRRTAFRTPRRILVIKLDAIGDLVLATPFLRELRRSFPAAKITLIVTPATAPLVELCPYIDRLVKYDPFRPDRKDREFHTLRARLFGHRLSYFHFDLAVLPRWDFDFSNGYHLLCGSGARYIAGFARTFAAVKDSWVARAERRGATILGDETSGHEVQRTLRLVDVVGGTATSEELEIWLSQKDHSRASNWLRSLGFPQRGPLVAFGIGASIVQKCWPAEKFAELARCLAKEFDARMILVGAGTADIRRAHAILERTRSVPVYNAVDQLSLRESAALLGRCDLFIGNDSAPMHLAASVRTPVVEICGLGADEDPNSNFSPGRFGPWKVPSHVVRPPASALDHSRVSSSNPSLQIGAVSIEAVRRAARQLLRRTSRPPLHRSHGDQPLKAAIHRSSQTIADK